MAETTLWSVNLTRRQAIAGTGALAVASAFSHAAASAEDTEVIARGTVFEATDGSFRRKPNARGIANVMVSNGREVVKTDADGRWALPVQEGDTIFVIKPSHWMTPIAPQTGLPQFFYHYAPGGTPKELGFRYEGLAPTGPLPESIDFPLQRREEKSQFQVLMFADPQPESSAELDFVRDGVLARAMGIDAAFGMTLGDIMFDDLSFYPRSNRLFGSLGLPWYNLPGNHDMNLEAPDNRLSRETYKRYFGPRSYAFQYGGVTFFMLDNVVYQGREAAHAEPRARYHGEFGATQLQFVRSVLANLPPDELVIFCMHIPLRTVLGPDLPNQTAIDRKAFLQTISGRKYAASFAGHTHTHEYHVFGPEDGFAGPGTHLHQILTAASGSWWSGPLDVRGIPTALATDGSPNGFHVLAIEGNRYATRLVAAADSAPSHLRLGLDYAYHASIEVLREERPGVLFRGPILREALPAADLVVNFFSAGPDSVVKAAIGANASFQPMQRVTAKDPFVEQVYAAHASSKKPWVNAQPCSHLWRLRLPAELAAGVHPVEVRAVDAFGRMHEAGMMLEVLAG